MRVAAVFTALALSCSTHAGLDSVRAEFDWVRPVNNYEAKFDEARVLAWQMVEHPFCKAQFAQLPDWPVGEVLTIPVWDLMAQSGMRMAFTNMATGVIYVSIQTILASSVERLASTLVHEMAHVASKSDFDQLRDLDQEEDAERIEEVRNKNERMVQEVTRRCMSASSIL